MAIARIRSRLSSSSPAQPPSPMPNSRISNPPFNNHVDKLKNIPEFDLPDDMTRPRIAEVEYGLIRSKDKKAVQQMLDSAVKFGVFRVTGHGIPPEELHAAFTEAEFCFGLLAERWSRDGDREEFAWSRSAMTMAERRREVKSDQNFHMFRSAFGEINIEPDIKEEEDKGAYSIEFKCSPANLNDAVDKSEGISIADQIIFIVIVVIVYNLFSYLLS
ncbi:hypothetical protein E3N88_17774 [Mikania micrantha]|uniref:Non-haem dioxygenase N-terminal domain-containing protein n=1 Tax=Mikania micrantha TaxID=192012 RepID=A0A5N6NVI7_9ASTR|nr:hypothetical protein E3N88_17774 [Mikania micrantha]